MTYIDSRIAEVTVTKVKQAKYDKLVLFLLHRNLFFHYQFSFQLNMQIFIFYIGNYVALYQN